MQMRVWEGQSCQASMSAATVMTIHGKASSRQVSSEMAEQAFAEPASCALQAKCVPQLEHDGIMPLVRRDWKQLPVFFLARLIVIFKG